MTLANNSITDNSAPSSDGGGVYNDYTASVALVGTNRIFWNSGGNCAPTNAVNGCTG